MFYLTTLNTIYLQLYSVRQMIKDHSDSEKEETHRSHVGSKGYFISQSNS